MHTEQSRLVQQSLVREMTHDTYAKRRASRRSMSTDIRLSMIEVLIDEAIVELALIKREIRLMTLSADASEAA